jgi:hypothetical protein
MCTKPDCLSSKILRGAVGLGTAAAIGLGIAPAQVSQDRVEDRRNKCRNCPAATRNPKYIDLPEKGLTAASLCRECKCNIKAKTMLADEKCPLGKW